MPATVLLFLKAPRPGFVKTRLACDLGDEAACEVYRKLAENTLAQIPPHLSAQVYFAPADAEQEMRDWLGPAVTLRPQAEGDLGQRLTAACEQNFSEGAHSVILLGGDCAALTCDHLNEAQSHLDQGQAVIGPARDGGYWLLGLAKHTPSLFQEIPWSQDCVFEKTMERFRALNLLPHTLEPLEDIDNLPALTRATPHHPFLSPYLTLS